jgi:hypothetical protein
MVKTGRSASSEYLQRGFKNAFKNAGRGSDQFMLRLPDGMRDMIAEMAEWNGRSMNAEIVTALAGYIARFSPGKPIPAGMTEVMNDAMAERIRQGEIQLTVREMGQKLLVMAKELDQVAAESRSVVLVPALGAGKPSDKKKNPPA